MCVSCGEMRPKKELLRMVKTPEGAIELDFTGKKNGRGAYICKSQACFEKLPRAGKRIELPSRALRTDGERRRFYARQCGAA